MGSGFFLDETLNFVSGMSTVLSDAFLAKRPVDLIDIVGVEDDETLIASQRRYLTLIEVKGAYGSVGNNEYLKIVKSMNASMRKILFENDRHEIKIYFESDPDEAVNVLNNNFAPSRAHVKRCGMDLDVLIDEKIRVNAPLVQKEKVYIGIYTKPNKKVDEIKFEGEGVLTGLTQALFKCETMLNYHKEVIRSFVEGLRIALNVDISKVDDVLRDIYGAINGSSLGKKIMFDKFTLSSSDVRKIQDLENLPNLKVNNDKFSKEVVRKFGRHVDSLNDKSLAVLMPEPLAEQLISSSIYDDGYGYVMCGSRMYAPLTAHGIGVDQKDFDFFVRSMNGLPFRISFTITPKGLDMNIFQHVALSLIGAFNESTRMKARALSALQKLKHKEAIVGLSINACTWAPIDKRTNAETGQSYFDTSLLAKRVERMKSASIDWCGLKLSDSAGDSVECLFSTLPGLRGAHVSKRSTAPLEEVMQLLPVSRVGSVWDSGSVLFRTEDGRLFPFEQMSQQQLSDVIVITGDMGSGKSSMMSRLDLSFVMQPSENDSLPYLRGIEFGYSQSGVVKAIQAGLSEENKHKAVYQQMQNTKQFAINNHDLPLGSRYPIQSLRDYLVNYLVTITDSISDYSNHSGLCGAAIDLAYQMYSDEEGNPQAKRYKRNIDTVVDEYVDKLEISWDENTTWFGLTDVLFSKDADRNGKHPYSWVAARAQRYAVPTIEDYQNIATRQELTMEYSHDYRGMPICKAFALAIRESIAELPMICGPTVFDVSESPVYIVDLKDLIPSGLQSRTTERKSAIIYMAVMRSLSADFFVDSTIVPYFNPAYQRYHALRIDRISRCKKRFFVDEKHRINSIKSAVAAIDAIVFEGRKFLISIIQGSQLLSHISDQIIKLATTVINCGSTSAEEVAEAQVRYGLSEYHCELIKSLTKPGRKGADFFVRYKLGDMTVFLKLVNTEGPVMLCLIATEAQDRAVRDGLERLAKRKSDAWKAYAAEFPSGKVGDEIKRRDALYAEGAYKSATGDIVKDIIFDVAQKHKIAA